MSRIELFDWAYDTSLGTLWWCREETVDQRFLKWRRRADRGGHPMVSIREVPLTAEADVIPMLVGTSKNSQDTRAVAIRGITKNEPARITYFSTVIEPGIFNMSDFHSNNGEPRSLAPADKRRVDEKENQALCDCVESMKKRLRS